MKIKELIIFLKKKIKNVSHTFFLYLCVSFEIKDDFSDGDGCSDLPVLKFTDQSQKYNIKLPGYSFSSFMLKGNIIAFFLFKDLIIQNLY